MRIYKKSYALLLIALIATTSLQAAPMDTLNALLVRMQKNVILRQVTAKRVSAFVGFTAAGIGLWWWLKNRQAENLVCELKNVETKSTESPNIEASGLVTLPSGSESLNKSADLLLVESPSEQILPKQSPVLSITSVPSSESPNIEASGLVILPSGSKSLNKSADVLLVESPSEQILPKQSPVLSITSVPSSAKKVALFALTKSMSSWQELPDILQEVQNNYGLDLSKTAVALDYDGTLVHDVYTLQNGKKLDLVLYESYGVKPELFKGMNTKYRDGKEHDLRDFLKFFIVRKYYSQEYRRFYTTWSLPSEYMEDQDQMQSVIANVIKQAAFVGICSSSSYKKERGDKVAQLGLTGSEDDWCQFFYTKFYDFNQCIKDKKKKELLPQGINTYILIDNDEANINQFTQAAQKENINALGIYYSRVDDMLTQDALSKEIDDLLPKKDSESAT